MTKGTILVADDDSAIRTVLHQALSRAGFSPRITSNAAMLWQWIARGDGDLVITDVVMPDENAFDILPRIKKARPDLPVVVMSAQTTVLTAITAAERGAYDYLPKPFDLNAMIALVERALAERRDGLPKNQKTGDEQDALPLIGRSPAMQDIYRTLARLTQNDLTVLITGESGTGKELVARALHDFSKRRNGPFVVVSMAATPHELIESELFGHEKGTFPGAEHRNIGRFEQVHRGTLFLDEIGDMPMDAQTRLLRVLQDGEYTTVGGRTPLKTDVRIIAATNRDLSQQIQNGLFREDLYYRLNVVPLRLPPLRERLDDIADLAHHFIRQSEINGGTRRTLEPQAIAQLKRHQWPGNVRELENLVNRLLALYSEENITAAMVEAELASTPGRTPARIRDQGQTLSQSLEAHLSQYFASHGPALPPPGLYQRILKEIEVPLITLSLAATRGNQIRAAEILGLNRNTLRKKIQDLGIQVIKTSI